MAELEYFRGTMSEMLQKSACQYPKSVALDFLGISFTYDKLISQIEDCAKALLALGVAPGDYVTIALPNCPQAVCMLYAVNMVGGVANILHPLSAPREIEYCLRQTQSNVLITLDQYYGAFSKAIRPVNLPRCVVTSLSDALEPTKKSGLKIPGAMHWKDFLEKGKTHRGEYPSKRAGEDEAVVLQSGGTTGRAKGVVLTNLNFNALAQQIIAANPMFRPGDKMLSVLPMFHGFGLGVCIHTMLTHGGRCILIPRFTPQDYAKDLVKYQCNFIAGVPTLFEALLRIPNLEKVNLSSLKGVFCGGDVLTDHLKQRVDSFLAEHKSAVCVREGYGLSEAVAVCCLTPYHTHRENSVGLPLPGNAIKIVLPGTKQEMPCGEVGEILIAGPAVMQGYLNCPSETKNILQTHTDGKTWLYTGDLGSVDKEGYVYFRGRAKRMIVTSGYNVYPLQIENILNAHQKVQTSCVIGVTDAYKMQKVRAFVKLIPGIAAAEETEQELMDYCREYISGYAIPCKILFCEDMPMTPLGKIDYRKLES